MSGLDPSDPLFERAVRYGLRIVLPGTRVFDDIAQAIRIALWRRGRASPWACARKVAIDELRAFLGDLRNQEHRKAGWGNLEQLTLEETLDPADPTPYQDVLLQRTVQRALERIEPRFREILHMRFWEELSAKEIGQRIGKSEPRALALVHTAEDRFRKAFRDMAD